MKPSYLHEADLPNEVREKTLNELPPGADKARAIEKLLAREVMMEQELATSEEPLKIKDLLKQKEQDFKTTLQIKEWALFTIGA